MSFEAWIDDFKVRAQTAGIQEQILNEALSGISPNMRVIELDRKQPEGKKTFSAYLDLVVTGKRIQKGRALLAEHRPILEKIGREYGVPPQYIVALWGIESSYGANTGGFSVVESLATLAWEGRRRDFFTGELVKALKILQGNHISLENMKGSWAGAMGQNQFMPSSFFNFAVDYNHDGRRDIWSDKADIFASTANYLSKSGWIPDERWGRSVQVPAGFSKTMYGLDTRKTLGEWSQAGVRLPGGGKIPVVSGMEASLVAPDGPGGRTFLVYDNYRVILKWNRSVYFASAVGLLADSLL